MTVSLEENRKKILDAYIERKDIEHFAKLVAIDEIVTDLEGSSL